MWAYVAKRQKKKKIHTISSCMFLTSKEQSNQWLSNFSIKKSPGGLVKMQNPGTPSPENTDSAGWGDACEFVVITSSQVLLMP